MLVLALIVMSAAPAGALNESEREEIRALENWYPRQACAADRELGQCFSWTVNDCELKAAKSLALCLRRHEKRMRGSATGDVTDWQDTILRCAFIELRDNETKSFRGGALCRTEGGGR